MRAPTEPRWAIDKGILGPHKGWKTLKMEWSYTRYLQSSWNTHCRNKIGSLLILKNVSCAHVSVNFLIDSL